MCNEEENEMTTNTLETLKQVIPNTRKPNITKALKEVELIQKGHLPKKNARDFLRESRNK